MKKPRHFAASAAAATALALSVSAGGAVAAGGTAVRVPAGFNVKERGVSEAVTYSVSVGEFVHAIERPVIEELCAKKRSIDSSTGVPVFEAGYDRRNTSETVTIVSAQARATYETLQIYGCSTPRTELCSCTYRVRTSRKIHLRKTGDRSVETIDIDLDQNTGRHNLLPRNGPVAYRAPEPPALDIIGPIVGHDTVADIPCAVHRLEIGNGRIERCVTERGPLVPEWMKGRQLSQANYSLDNGEWVKRESWRTQRVVNDAVIDSGVFDAPDGVVVKRLGSLRSSTP